MLAVLQAEERKTAASSTSVDDDARSLVAVCYGYRGALEDCWRTYDPMLRGVIKRKDMLKGMKKVNPEFTNSDLSVLLVIRILSFLNKKVLNLLNRILPVLLSLEWTISACCSSKQTRKQLPIHL